MGSEWTKCSLSNIANIQTGPFGSQLHNEDYVLFGTPIVTVEHLGKRRFSTQNLPRVSEQDKNRLSKYILTLGDIVFSRVGSVDRCSYVSKEYEGWMFSGRCLRVRPETNRVYAEFLYYALNQESTKQQIRNIAVGATMPSINTSLLGEVTIDLPTYAAQRSIAATLSSLDDKIELNNRIIANLEAQAQAIFKSWFVDFEPCQDGEFEESELGLIPKGWRVGTLDELIDIRYGKDHKRLGDGNIPVYGSGGIMRFADEAIYLGESVLIPRKGTLGNVLYVTGQFWTVDTMFYTIMRKDNIAKFVYLFVLGLDLASMNSGSAVPSMTTNILNAIRLVIPKDKTLESFESVVSPMYRTMKQLETQNEKLAKLRDTLLPKLMSGEIEVPVEG
jgi:type I restriction enzyme S subunit